VLPLRLDDRDRQSRLVLQDVVGAKRITTTMLPAHGDDSAGSDRVLLDDLVVAPPGSLKRRKHVVATCVLLERARCHGEERYLSDGFSLAWSYSVNTNRCLRSFPRLNGQRLSCCRRPTTIPGAIPSVFAKATTSAVVVSSPSAASADRGMRSCDANASASCSTPLCAPTSLMNMSFFECRSRCPSSWNSVNQKMSLHRCRRLS